LVPTVLLVLDVLLIDESELCEDALSDVVEELTLALLLGLDILELKLELTELIELLEF
jgi:hypothetical protein